MIDAIRELLHGEAGRLAEHDGVPAPGPTHFHAAAAHIGHLVRQAVDHVIGHAGVEQEKPVEPVPQAPEASEPGAPEAASEPAAPPVPQAADATPARPSA